MPPPVGAAVGMANENGSGAKIRTGNAMTYTVPYHFIARQYTARQCRNVMRLVTTTSTNEKTTPGR